LLRVERIVGRAGSPLRAVLSTRRTNCDGSHVYWANGNAGTIGRADLNGQNANQSFITGATNPRGVAVNPE